jgi:hypothetical protein
MKSPPEDDAFIEDDFLRALLFEPNHARTLLSGDGRVIAPASALDWTRFVEKAVREGVAAVLFHHLHRCRLEDLLPRETIGILSNHYHANLKRNLVLIGDLREVLTAFHEEGVPCIVLKGMALAEQVYSNIALRGMSDVDVLVKKGDLFRADACLVRRGYGPRDSTAARAIHNPAGYLASLEYREEDASPLNLHLHWHPVNTSVPATVFVDRIDLDRLWEKAVPVRVADSQTLMLCPEHLIIYLCEHALRVGHSFDRMILVCDISCTIEAFADRIDWEFLVRESRHLGLIRFVYHGLTIVRHHTGLGILDETIATLKPPDLSWGEKFFLRLQMSDRRIRGSSYLIYLALNQGLLAKLRFIARTFFPPRPILLQRRHEKDQGNIKSYYWARLREILSHIHGSLARYLIKIIV